MFVFVIDYYPLLFLIYLRYHVPPLDLPQIIWSVNAPRVLSEPFVNTRSESISFCVCFENCHWFLKNLQPRIEPEILVLNMFVLEKKCIKKLSFTKDQKEF